MTEVTVFLHAVTYQGLVQSILFDYCTNKTYHFQLTCTMIFELKLQLDHIHSIGYSFFHSFKSFPLTFTTMQISQKSLFKWLCYQLKKKGTVKAKNSTQ